jgi:uncharacterized protein
MNFTNRIFHSPSEGAAVPVSPSQRIPIIDSIRGFALLGILLMNIPYFADAFYRGENPLVMKETGLNYYTWWTMSGAFEGTMRALFSILFGAGTLLLLTRLEKKENPQFTPADIYYRRLFILLSFGVVNAFVFLWPGDILFNYALCGLFLYPFRNWKARNLLIVGLLVMLFTTYKETRPWWRQKEMRVKGEAALQLQKNKTTLTEKQEEELKKWQAFQVKTNPDSLRKEVGKERAEMQKGYFSIYYHLRPWNIKFESTMIYKFWFWDVIALFFIGMALFKWGVLTGKRSSRFYLLMLLICYALGFSINIWALQNKLSLNFDSTRYLDRMWINLYQERRLLQALGHMSLIMLLYKNGVFGFLWKWLSKVGQMAFSNYLMQSIICVTIFYGFGFGVYGKLERYQWYIVVGSVWVFQILFSNLWLRYFRFGPFEWLWRSLTYWKKQPMKRKQEVEEPALVPKPVPEMVS